MAIYSREQAEALLKKVIALSKADHIEASLSGSDGGNIRYARNAVSTSGETSATSLSVSSTFGKRSGSASINEFDDASLEKLVRRAEEVARLAPENPEFVEPLGPQQFKESKTYNAATAAVNAEKRADLVASSLNVAKQNNLEAAGFLENTHSFRAIMNSKGLFAYNQNTDVDFSVTLRNQDGTGSGYVSQSFNDIAKLDTLAQSKIAAAKATGSAGARAIEPGKYTVVLEPLAASDFFSAISRGFDARSADEGRSYLSKKGGGNKLGEKLLGDNITIYSDPNNAEMPSSTFSFDGRPQERRVWIDKGVVKNLSYTRYWAQNKNVPAVPPAQSIIFEGGTKSTADLIKETEKGILVTRFWYIRMVDPQTLLLTGLTRDGTFYIENGQVKFPIKNFRFNESPIIALNNVEELGKPVRSGNIVIPPMKIREFTFTSLSDAV